MKKDPARFAPHHALVGMIVLLLGVMFSTMTIPFAWAGGIVFALTAALMCLRVLLMRRAPVVAKVIAVIVILPALALMGYLAATQLGLL